MNSKTELPRSGDEEWARRKKNNVRLGWVFGGVAFLLFLLAFWKYRPL